MKKSPVILALSLLLWSGCVSNQNTDAPIPLPGNLQGEDLDGPIGYVGCSNTVQTIQGYHDWGGTRFWEPDPGYNGGSVNRWVEEPESTNPYWAVFDTHVQESPDTKIVWWELCIPKGDSPTYEDGMTIINALRERIPGVSIYINSLPEYADAECSITGVSGIEKGKELVEELVSQNQDVHPGPFLGPMTLDDTSKDGCHLSPHGKEKLGEQLIQFFK